MKKSPIRRRQQPGLAWFAAATVLFAVAAAAAVTGSAPGGAREIPAARIAATDGVGLELAWRRDLGPGNSRVAVANGIAVTFFSDGASDQVVALDAATGRQRWLYRIDDTYRGHDGSRDGPNGSPLIHDDVVYGLGPGGRLFAIALDDGTELWSLDLVAGHVPFWGFASTPVVADGTLVVPTGGPPPGSISGFDPESGERLWSTGEDVVDYQSPAVITLGGVEQIVATTNRWVMGLAPRSGGQLWSVQHSDDGSNGTSQAVAVGEDLFLLTASSGERFSDAMLFRVERRDGAWVAERLWESRALAFTFAVPVRHGSHLFGFQRSFLTCVDLATGESVWKSRAPGGSSLGLVDGRLVIFGNEGEVVLAHPSAEGYRELARMPALDWGADPAPTVDGTFVFVRNHDEIAAVRMVEADAVRGEPLELERGAGTGAFDGLLERLESLPEAARPAAVDEFMARQPRFPIVEEDGTVHFLYRGPASDVAIWGIEAGLDDGDPMRRVAGTDLFYRTYHLEPGGRWDYWFVVDLDDYERDPLNTDRAMGMGSPSQLAMPGWKRPSYMDDPVGPVGTVETFEFASETLDNRRDVQIYLPPGYATADEVYPLLVVVDGLRAAAATRMKTALDNLVGHGVRPLVVAFVGPSKAAPVEFAEGGPDPYREHGGTRAAEMATALARELVPVLENRYRLVREPDARAVFGLQAAGLTALRAAASHPDVFGRVAVQSLWFGPTVRQSSRAMPRPVYESTLDALRNAGEPKPVVYLDWARHELADPQLDVDLASDGAVLAATLRDWGYRVLGGQYPGASGAGSWNARLGDLLTSLFPEQPEEPAVRRR